MRNILVLVIAICAGCASNPSSESIESRKVQSSGRPWTAIPVHMPSGEEGVIMSPNRDWPMFTEGKAGTATQAEAKKATEDYVAQEKLPCSVGDIGNELSHGGWVVNLTCTATASRKK